MSANSHLLTDKKMKDFIQNGYVTINSLLPDSLHKDIYKQTKTVFEKEGNPGNNLLPRIPAIQEILDSGPVQGALVSILGENYYLQPHRHCHYNPPGSKGQNLHQDGGKRWSHHTRRVLMFYYPQDTPLELGPTAILPSSHYYNTVESTEIIEEFPLCGKAGTIAIVHYDLWHRALPNFSKKNRYMMKFLFLRMLEPQKPSWKFQNTSWEPENMETGNNHRILNHIWKWHCGKSNNEIPLTTVPHSNILKLIEDLASDSELSGQTTAYKLSEIGAQVVHPLLETLNSKSKTKRRNACYALSTIGEPAVNTLKKALKDQNEWVRDSAAEILGDIGLQAQSAIPELMQAVQDGSEQVRAHAVEALGTTSQMEYTAVPSLCQALQDKNDLVRRNATLALARLGNFSRDAVGMLTIALKDRDRYVRADASYALQQINTAEARKALFQFLTMSRWCPITSPENTF